MVMKEKSAPGATGTGSKAIKTEGLKSGIFGYCDSNIESESPTD